MTRSTRVRFVACLVSLALTGVFLITHHVRADLDQVPLLQQALRFRVTIHIRPQSGFMFPAYHCRRATGGCDARLQEFAQYLNDAGAQHGIDPWLLAAMAFRESGLNPFAVGLVGERGILQLHPRGPAKKVRFVRDSRYRERCKKEVGACQREVVDRAALVLARSLVKCGGDLEQALTMYNAGRCGGTHVYAARVFHERDLLRKSVGLDAQGLVGPGLAQLHTTKVIPASAARPR